MKITTNNQKRELISFFDLPEKVRPDFDYVENDDKCICRFVKFKGSYYDTFDTQAITTRNGQNMDFAMAVNHSDPLAKWNSVISESFFSGVLFRFVDNFEYVICGCYYS